MQPCECGCGALANKRFLRGHASRRQARGPGGRMGGRGAAATVAAGASVPAAAVRPPPAAPPFYEVEPEPEPGTAGGGGFGSISTPDPEPAHLSGGGPGTERAASAPGHSPASPTGGADRKVIAEVEAHLGAFVMLPAELAIMVDPYCGPILLESAPKMIKTLAPIIAQSERVVAFVTGTSGLLQWGQFFVACKPAILAVIAHHLTHRVTTEKDDATGETRIFQVDLSAYTAA